jgi:hypothetical protein
MPHVDSPYAGEGCRNRKALGKVLLKHFAGGDIESRSYVFFKMESMEGVPHPRDVEM